MKTTFKNLRNILIVFILIALGTSLNVFNLPHNQEFLLRTIAFVVAVILAVICYSLNRKIKNRGQ
nr:Mid2-like cell wall stress sensor domain protein [Bacillus cereus]